jgi:hypothetical protein
MPNARENTTDLRLELMQLRDQIRCASKALDYAWQRVEALLAETEIRDGEKG